MKVILSKRGQITIPVNERRELGIEGKKVKVDLQTSQDGLLIYKLPEKCSLCSCSYKEKLRRVANGYICETCLKQALNTEVNISEEDKDKYGTLIMRIQQAYSSSKIQNNKLNNLLESILIDAIQAFSTVDSDEISFTNALKVKKRRVRNDNNELNKIILRKFIKEDKLLSIVLDNDGNIKDNYYDTFYFAAMEMVSNRPPEKPINNSVLQDIMNTTNRITWNARPKQISGNTFRQQLVIECNVLSDSRYQRYIQLTSLFNVDKEF